MMGDGLCRATIFQVELLFEKVTPREWIQRSFASRGTGCRKELEKIFRGDFSKTRNVPPL